MRDWHTYPVLLKAEGRNEQGESRSGDRCGGRVLDAWGAMVRSTLPQFLDGGIEPYTAADRGESSASGSVAAYHCICREPGDGAGDCQDHLRRGPVVSRWRTPRWNDDWNRHCV